MDIRKVILFAAKKLAKGDAKYRNYFNKKMKEWGIRSPQDLSYKERQKFFLDVDEGWMSEKEKEYQKKAGRQRQFDPEIEDMFKEAADLIPKVEELQKELKGYERQIKRISPVLINALEETKSKAHKVGDLKVILLKKMGKKSVSWKKSFEDLVEEVGGQIDKLSNAIVEANTKLPKIKKELGIERRAGIISWLKGLWNKLKSAIRGFSSSVDKLEQLAKQPVKASEKTKVAKELLKLAKSCLI